jgi:predicted GIY-YIG superfamily endonuclease
MKQDYCLYILYDYKDKPFYIGITKNIKLRIREHELCDRKNLAKDYRVRRCIKERGELVYSVRNELTKLEAINLEKKLINKYRKLVNKQHGRYKNDKQLINKRGRKKKCPICGLLFWRLKQHKCKGER